MKVEREGRGRQWNEIREFKGQRFVDEVMPDWRGENKKDVREFKHARKKVHE